MQALRKTFQILGWCHAVVLVIAAVFLFSDFKDHLGDAGIVVAVAFGGVLWCGLAYGVCDIVLTVRAIGWDTDGLPELVRELEDAKRELAESNRLLRKASKGTVATEHIA